MADEPRDRTLTELEDNQNALRKNIEASKELIARSGELIGRYRAERDASRPADDQTGEAQQG
jgi:hypothetical protein